MTKRCVVCEAIFEEVDGGSNRMCAEHYELSKTGKMALVGVNQDMSLTGQVAWVPRELATKVLFPAHQWTGIEDMVYVSPVLLNQVLEIQEKAKQEPTNS